MPLSELLATMLILLSAAMGAWAVPLSAEEARQWSHWLCPLPKEIVLTGRATAPLAALRVRLPAEATEWEQNLREELQKALAERAGLPALNLAAPGGAAVVEFVRPGQAKKALAGRRNMDQGYVINGHERAGRVELRCEALTDMGLYYAMKTLKQLLLPTVQGSGPRATVDLPLGRVVDWPDLEERGQWGGSCVEDLEWLSDFKFNLIELHAELKVDERGVPQASMNTEIMARARRHAVRIVPIIHHLEQLSRTGIFRAYPQLKAIGAETDNPQLQSLCFARPESVKILAGWMTQLGQIPGVKEIMVWLSEEGKGCQCEQCRKKDRFVSEVEALAAAWAEAKKSCPSLGLRVLLTQSSYPSNDKVIAALAPGMKLSYYHGSLTYNTERKPMIYPLLEEYVKRTGWLGVYPTLSSNWLTVAPFSNPEFTHYRLTEFVDKGLTCLVAYVVPTTAYYQMNTEGGLEWAWNAQGRTPAEFAVSYAIRHGLQDPDRFRRWTELIGPAAWDLYASNFPYWENWGAPTAKIAAGEMKVSLGQKIFAAFSSEQQFADNIRRCEEALRLAAELGEPQYIYETQIVLGYTRLLQGVYGLSRLWHGEAVIPPENRVQAERLFRQCQDALSDLLAAYPRWHEACFAGRQGKAPGRFGLTVRLMEQLAAALSELMEKQGFVDEEKPYRAHRLGEWKTEDFREARRQTRRLAVTPYVSGAGRYSFQPVYRRGTLGLVCHRVALLSFPKENPEETREEAVDQHDGHAGAWTKDDIYLLDLPAYDPTRGYDLLVEMSGGETTEGEFIFKKLRE